MCTHYKKYSRGVSSFTAESVPKKPLARMDYVVVMVDMTQAYSLTLLDQALHHMQDRFLTNKMAVMVTKSKSMDKHREGKRLISTQWINVVNGNSKWSEYRN